MSEHVWVAGDDDFEECGEEAASPEAAARNYFEEVAGEGVRYCLACRQPTIDEQADWLPLDGLGERLLDHLASVDPYALILDHGSWPDIRRGEPLERLNEAVKSALVEYLTETGNIGPRAPWCAAESVEFELVDGEVRRVPPAEDPEAADG